MDMVEYTTVDRADTLVLLSAKAVLRFAARM